MSRIGTIEEVQNDGQTEFWGSLSTLTYDFKFRMIGNPDQQGMNSPEYLILTKSRSGQDIQIGSAWKKKPRQYGQDDYLSLTFDDPSFEKPLNVAAFTSDGGKTWDISWRRRQNRAEADAA